MKRYEITVSKVIYHLVDEFENEEEARAHALKMRDSLAQKHGSFGKPIFYELEEAG